jgi:hypothetical protein
VQRQPCRRNQTAQEVSRDLGMIPANALLPVERETHRHDSRRGNPRRSTAHLVHADERRSCARVLITKALASAVVGELRAARWWHGWVHVDRLGRSPTRILRAHIGAKQRLNVCESAVHKHDASTGASERAERLRSIRAAKPDVIGAMGKLVAMQTQREAELMRTAARKRIGQIRRVVGNKEARCSCAVDT